MTNGNEFKLGGNAGNIDFSKLKAGVKRSDFGEDAKILQIFDSVDTNSNQVLESEEVSLFTEKMIAHAGDDAVFSKKEVERAIEEQQKVKADTARQEVKQERVKANDVYSFLNQYKDISEKSKVKSSIVDENGTRTVVYEDGAQEVINKDGSRVITTISGGLKTTQTRNADGTLEQAVVVNDEDGSVETLVFGDDGKTVTSHSLKNDAGTFEIGTEGVAKGRVIKETIGSGDEQQVTEYNYTDANNFTKTLTYKDTVTVADVKDGKVTNLTSTQYDENNNKVQTVNIAEDGTQTVSLYKDSKVVYDRVEDGTGRVTETQYNENGYRTMQQITSPEGTIQIAQYDGSGNTRVVVQNGETVGSMAQKFNRTTQDLVSLNRGHVYKDDNNNPYFLVGDEVRVNGEFPANHRGLSNRGTAEHELAEYSAQEAQRVVARLEGKEQKAIYVKNEYANWTEFAKAQLKSEGVSNPTNEQITNRTNELVYLNQGVAKPKKGSKIVAIKTEADITAERQVAERQHARDLQRNIVEGMRADYNKAVKSFNHQMDKDGWAADVADGVSYIWNNDWWSATGNTARQVRQDLATYHTQLDELRTAYKQGDAQFKAKFNETFGVEYNQQNIESYYASKQKLADVSTAVATERAITSRMDKLFEEGNQTAIQNELQSLLGLSNDDMSKLKQKLAAEGKSLDMDYMKNLYSEMKTGLAENTKKALGNKTLEQYQSEMDNAYKKAFGTRNDIVERVEKYNTSQDVGAEVVKTAVKIAGSAVIAVATGGTATGLLIAAVGTSALSFGVDASDMLSDNTEHTSEEYLKAGKDALIDGGAQLISGGTSRLLKANQATKLVRYSVQAAADLGADLGSEYLRTGEVNMSTAIISVVSSVGGEALGDFLEARKTNKALSEAMDEAIDNSSDLTNLDQGWLASPDDVASINPEHSRFRYEVTSADMGGGTRMNINGVDVELNAPQGFAVDVTSAQRQSIQADVASLGVKGREFQEGLEKLEAVQVARTSYTSRADGVIDYAATQGMGQRSSGVSTRSAVTAPSNSISSAAPDWRASSGMREDVFRTLSDKGVLGDTELLEDCANLSGKVYGSAVDKETKELKSYKGWNIIKDNDGNAMIMSETNGFHARAYQKDGRVIVTFRGSDDVGDLASDFAMLAGRTPEQLDNAIDFVARVKDQCPDAQIIVTGHSLGGSLTEMVASRYDDVVGFTFDAVGTRNIVEGTSGALIDNHNTVNYIVHGDVLSNADAHVGQTVVVSNISKGGEQLSPHAIGNFMGNNSALAGVESGILARQATAHTNPNAPSLSKLVQQSSNGQVILDDRQFSSIAERFAYDVNTMGADLDALERQITSIASPEQRTQLQNIIDARRVSITQGADIQANTNTLRSLSGDEVNDVLARDFGFTEPGFLGGNTPSAEIVTNKPTKFVRVFNDQSSYARGTWLMPYDEVVGKTPEQIKDFYALPAMPKYIVEVEVPAGTRMFTGKCNPLEGWGNGGGTQFFITNNFEIPTNFDNKRLIQQAVNN